VLIERMALWYGNYVLLYLSEVIGRHSVRGLFSRLHLQIHTDPTANPSACDYYAMNQKHGAISHYFDVVTM